MNTLSITLCRHFPKLLAVTFLCWLVSPSQAADLTCVAVEPGTIHRDGIIDEWTGIAGVVAAEGNSAGLQVKCALEGGWAHFLIDVEDSYFVRTAQTHPGEDHVTWAIGEKGLKLYPGDARALPVKQLPLQGKKPPGKIMVSSSKQPRGWAMELSVRADDVGLSARVPYAVHFFDCNSKAALKTERDLEVSGELVHPDGGGALEGFLQDRGLNASMVRKRGAITLGGRRKGTFVLAANYLAVITEEYRYIELPTRTSGDLLDFKVVDLTGDRRQAFVIRYREPLQGSAEPVEREVVAVYRFDGAQPARIVAMEVARKEGSRSLRNRVRTVVRQRATDLVIDNEQVVGFSEAAPPTPGPSDVLPLFVPWQGTKQVKLVFQGDEYRLE